MRFTNLLKSIILEAQEKIDFLIDTYAKSKKKKDGSIKKSKLSPKELSILVAADPETNLHNIEIPTSDLKELAKVKAGPYSPWIIKRYLELNQNTEIPYGESGYERELKTLKERFMEDLYKVTEDLKKFDRFKSRIPQEYRDINKLTTEKLYDLVKDFDLTIATTSKAERKSAPVHPGAKLIYDSSNLRVVEITDKSSLGKEAACFYGGNQKETRWCTSAPGLSHFDYYIGKGPLYVVFDPSDPNVSPTTGLPVERYQLSFETDQFMDRHDHSFDIIEKLNGPWKDLKQTFKSKFAKGLTTGGTKLTIDNFRHGNVGKFVALYGLDELFESLPDTLDEIAISQKSDKGQNIDIKIPPSIKRFKNMEVILLDNCISSLPDEICQLKELKFLSLLNNPNLKELPDCINNLKNLAFIALTGSPNVRIPEWLKKRGRVMRKDDSNGNLWDLEYDK
jgi:hypothetical protein